MKRVWIWVVVLGACGRGPSLDATNERHVMIEVEGPEHLDSCMIPCGRAVRPNEHITRCAATGSRWSEPVAFDMATRLGPLSHGYVLCSLAGDRK